MPTKARQFTKSYKIMEKYVKYKDLRISFFFTYNMV